ncbi:CGNR zinc finger domain-containing protein [Nonomuraea sp. SBT364]|uniref:CGNR zinc finger domain-containing protein n=1 Tax=Nonomuraea sp. SBT364 TaxID=1580530 RepID=UPI00066C44C6|nr:CGNR zinc finger domain-containing protein [Nonomuraea sp. SBT364]
MLIPMADYAWGAAVANDLVSTSPTVRGAEGLPTAEALAEFLTRHDLPPGSADDLFAVQLFRREARGVLETETEEHAVMGATVLARRAGLSPVLDRDPSARWQWYVPTAPDASLADELAALVGVALLGVVRTLGHERFRACLAPGCRGVFADISRAGRRRYCMPDVCGNRLNVANHRDRRRVVS